MGKNNPAHDIERLCRDVATQTCERPTNSVDSEIWDEALRKMESEGEAHPSLRDFVKLLIADPDAAILNLTAHAIHRFEATFGQGYSTDLERITYVFMAYKNKHSAIDSASGDTTDLPVKPGMASANAIGTMATGGYFFDGERWVVPSGALPQEAGRKWLQRLRTKYSKRTGISDPTGGMHDGLVRMMLDQLPKGNP